MRVFLLGRVRVRVRVWVGERGVDGIGWNGFRDTCDVLLTLPYGTQEDWTFRRLLT